MLQTFIETLSDLQKAHQELVDIADQKKDVLVKGDIQTLSVLLKQEANLVKQIGKIEKDRLFQLQEISKKTGIPEQNLTMNDILEHLVSDEEKATVNNIVVKLQDTFDILREKNQLNLQLTQDSLDYVNQSIELMTEVQSNQVNYNKPQKSSKDKKVQDGQSFFDAKA